jgi:hypothetical protein
MALKQYGFHRLDCGRFENAMSTGATDKGRDALEQDAARAALAVNPHTRWLRTLSAVLAAVNHFVLSRLHIP